MGYVIIKFKISSEANFATVILSRLGTFTAREQSLGFHKSGK